MEYKFILHKDKKYLEVITSGTADADGSLAMAKTISEKMRANKITRALVDHSNISGVSGKVVDVYNRPKIFRLLGMLLGIRIAEVVRPEHMEHFRFLETVSVNNGFKFSVFHNRDKALEWLLF